MELQDGHNKGVKVCQLGTLTSSCGGSLSRPVDVVLSAGAHRSQTVNLIEEDDGGTHVIRLKKTRSDTHTLSDTKPDPHKPHVDTYSQLALVQTSG